MSHPVDSIRIHPKYPSSTLRASRDGPGTDPVALAVLAYDGLLAAGAGLFRALSLNAEVAWCDGPTGYPLPAPAPPRRFHQLRSAVMPDGVQHRAFWTETTVATAPRLDRDTVPDWVRSILPAGTPPAGTRPGWSELFTDVVRVRLPAGHAPDPADRAGTLGVDFGAGRLYLPAEWSGGEVWASGPLDGYSDSAPLGVRIVNEAGYLTLDLVLYWSSGAAADPAATTAAAAQRLAATGWQVR